jgi:hypothetical protein
MSQRVLKASESNILLGTAGCAVAPSHDTTARAAAASCLPHARGSVRARTLAQRLRRVLHEMASAATPAASICRRTSRPSSSVARFALPAQLAQTCPRAPRHALQLMARGPPPAAAGGEGRAGLSLRIRVVEGALLRTALGQPWCAAAAG